MTTRPPYTIVRLAIIAWLMVLISVVVWIGVQNLTELTVASNTFLLAVLGLLELPLVFIFNDRWFRGE